MKVMVLSSFTTSLFWFRLDMMKAFQKQGYEVLAVGEGPEEDWAQRFQEEGIRYRSIPVQRNGTNPIKDLKTLFALKRLLKEEKPDKIFAYQAKTVIYGGMAARMNGIREFYPLIAGVGSVFLGSGLKGKLLRTILVLEYRLGMGMAAGCFFQNKDDLEVFVSNKIVKPQLVTMLHGSGVNIDRFHPAPLPEKPAFLCISRLIRDKGVCEYLDACRLVKSRHPEVRCMLVGPFDTNPTAVRPEELQAYIDDGSVEYFGEQKDVYPYLVAASVFVLPSYREGTPKTVLEAMASGRAVITTDAPGCRETVSQGGNGLMVPVRDVQALAEAMERLMDDPEGARAMGVAGRKLAENQYDVRLVNQTIIRAMKMEVRKEAVRS